MAKVTLSADFAVELLNRLLVQEQGFVSATYQEALGNRSQELVQWFNLQKEISDGQC